MTSTSPELVTLSQPRSAAAEAYRTLRTNLQFLALDRPLRSVLVTAAAQEDGAATTAANLAVAVGQAGRRVILVDADLRRPAVHVLFGARAAPGLSNVLLSATGDGSTADELPLQPSPEPNLRLLTAGSIPPNPAELLATPRVEGVISALTAEADLVLISAPPVTTVTDAALLAARTDGTLLLVSSGRVRREMARRAKAQLESVQARVLGVVLTNASSETLPAVDYYAPDPEG